MLAMVGMEAFCQVPQQQAWVVERLGKFSRVLEPGLNWITPVLDKVSYRHSLKETPLDV
ncbi:MAG: paraslipin, partial [Betaproteobacteria bacterium]|nr:paraslipin [Betaproteobacteria bacterium]